MELVPVAAVEAREDNAPPRKPARRKHFGFSYVLLIMVAGCCWFHWNRGDKGEELGTAFASVGFMKQAAPPAIALLGGLALYGMGGPETVAILLIYFGAQTGMNLYIKNVLSRIVVDEEQGRRGLPIGFLLTAIQQMVAFLAFCIFLLAGRLCCAGYQVKTLKTCKEWVAVICFSMAFALNIGLNNFSLSLVAISINMIIRTCLPLSTAISELILGSILGIERKSIGPTRWLLMLAGVSCAGLASYAKTTSQRNPDESAALALGITVTVCSIFAGAVNMVLASILGTSMKMNPLDTTCYMSLPTALALILPSLVVYHPVAQWPHTESMTDWQILQEVMQTKPSVLLPVLISGVLSFFYNILQYTMVHKLSATHATFAGNFNKAATIALSLLLGLEGLPPGNYGIVFLVAVIGNIASFTAFSMVKDTPPKS
ncbi:unnamed protein product [Symbiodinium pilosum]|uniref:Sugar phosphate transporter domain-containing protein n=1 Tax=Symbiodinium pilosum TaxID=2952 RepID=A0A812UFG5_SYMPI|nr:unnamed protein product [Symbiodinium pilosum]